MKTGSEDNGSFQGRAGVRHHGKGFVTNSGFFTSHMEHATQHTVLILDTVSNKHESIENHNSLGHNRVFKRKHNVEKVRDS